MWALISPGSAATGVAARAQLAVAPLPVAAPSGDRLLVGCGVGFGFGLLPLGIGAAWRVLVGTLRAADTGGHDTVGA